jgi:hypothetical protein
MKPMIVSLFCSAAMCAAILPTSALAAGKNVKTPVINQREQNQQSRIKQGAKSGELNRRETTRLEAQEARLRVNEKFDKADGKITAAERERLQKELQRTSQNIYDQKHDAQVQK